MTRKRLAVALAVAALGLLSAGASLATVPRASTPEVGAKTCPPGYVLANLSWGQKCLRAGEFCKVGNPEYHAYGFDCPAGHLVSYTSAPSTTAPPKTTSACGVERWTVKTLQDRPALLPPVTTTVHYLITRPAPSHLASTRLPFERHVFTITAAVVLIRPEADSDLHVILHAGGETMIAEAPSPSCDSRATPLRRRQMTTARRAVRLCSRAQVTGVAFFDFDHGQTGVAPNAIELHPILGFRCRRG